MTEFEFSKSQVTTRTLANASEVVARVMLNVAGNDLSNKMGNSTITLTSLRSLALARIQRNLKISNV